MTSACALTSCPRQGGIQLRIWHLISQYWRLIGGFAAAGLALGITVAFLITPVYRAEAVVAPVPDPGQFPGIEALSGQLGGVAAGLLGLARAGEPRTQEHIATMRSRLLTNRFILENNLIPIIFEERYKEEDGNWRLDGGEEEPSLEEAYRRFNDDIRHISESKQTGLITLAVDWRDPEVASRWANELIWLANSEIRRQAIELGEKSISFLNKELAQTNVVEIKQAIYKLIEAQIQNIMIANVRDEYAFRVIDPAGIPDIDDPRSPNRSLITALFFGIGGMLGLLAASYLDGRTRYGE